MGLIITFGALGAIVATFGVLGTVRQRRSRDYSDRLDPRDVPGRGHTEGQAAAGVGHHVRATGSGGWGI
jgi:hypothetical protein